MKKHFIIIFFIFSLLVSHSYGGNSQRKFDFIDSGEGLSSRFIISILKDKQGFMWLGTVNGLVKYDGYRWTTYRKQLLHPKIPHSHIVVSLLEDDQGILWLGTRNALIRFDKSREDFRHFRVRIPDSSLSSFTQIGGIREDPNNANILWLLVLNKLARFNKITGQITYFGFAGDQSKLRDIEDIRQFQLDRNGNIWMAAGNVLLKYNPVTDELIDFREKDYIPPSPPAVIYISKSSRNPDILWAGYIGAVERIDTVTGESTFHTLPLGEKKPVITVAVESFNSKNTLLLVAWGDGLYEYNLESGVIHHFCHDPDNPHSLVNDTIYSMFQDECGTIWLGTGSGLNRLEDRKNRIETVRMKHGNQPGLSNGLIYFIKESIQNPGLFLVGTADGLTLYDRGRNEFRVLNFGRSGPIGPNHITDGMESGSFPDVLWLTSLGGGLYKLNTRDKTVKIFTPKENENSSVGSRFLISIHESEKNPGCFWIGSMDNGMDFFDARTGRFRHYRHNEKNEESISPGPVDCFHESADRPGILWIGTIGGGFNKFNNETGKFKRFEHDPQDPAGLSGDMINCMYESPQEPGILWIATTKGLDRFDTKKEVFIDYPGKARLMKFCINYMVEDKSGILWITTYQGLLRYNRRNGAILHLDARDGFLSNDMAGIYIGKNGDIFLGTLSGLNVFRAGDIRRNTVVPPVVITELRISNRPVKVGQTWNRTSPVLEKSISRTRRITLSYKDPVFSFQYAALNYYIPGKNQYAYKMEGFDDDWINVGSSREAKFTGLSPGEYTFRVKGSNNDGVWNETGASIKVIITPPWWKTTWAYILYGLALLLLGFLANLLQRRRLVRRERDQARLREADLRARASEAQAMAMEAENRRKSAELEEARRLQLSMLPKKVPSLPGLEIAAYMQTATEVGGDYYDFFTPPGENLMVACGDATGHGLNAGTMVSIMKGILTSHRPGEDLPGFFATCTATMKQMKLPNLFMGLILLQQQKENWSVISAGMPPVYVYREKSREVEVFTQKTPPLGAFSKYSYTPRSIRLQKGDVVLLFSDGLPELFNDREEMFGYESVKDCFAKAAAAGLSPDHIIDALREAGGKWKQDRPQDDDITFVVLKITK